MEKKLRSSLRTSGEDFLSSAISAPSAKRIKPTLKTLIWSIPTSSSSSLLSTLPTDLHLSISRSLESFKRSLRSDGGGDRTGSPCSPPSKRPRRSSRHRREPLPSPANDKEEKNSKIEDETLVHLKNLQIYADIAHLCVSHPKRCFSPADLLPAVQLLHNSLVLFEMDLALLYNVASLCEEWWKERLPGRETLISQSLPFLLSRSLVQGKKKDLHRVYALREAFALFDFVDESIEDLRLLLVRCIITPLYLKLEEGRRFITFVFGLNLQLLKESLALIKSQIPFGRKSVLVAYADILFRTWKCSDGSLREEIESGFLQGLIEGAILASSRLLATYIRRVIGGFIEQRATEGVDKLLFRLTEPLLFRSLQVANSNVRQNALHLLIDMFPVEDPDGTREVKDTLLEKQFFLLERLLEDDCPDVRVVAVEGSCRILRMFWEVIPSPTITKILTMIVDNMSNDACNDVRLSTVNGIIYLLENPQTHEIMKVLLPRLGFLFLDSALSIRLAVADLLLAIRDIRTFQFNKVVGLDSLLSCLANDEPLIARKITKLLIPSYFPSKLTIKEACSRCIALIKRSPAAGARFCEFALFEGPCSKSLLEFVKFTVGLALSSKDLDPDKKDALVVAAANLCLSLSSETSCKEALSEFFSRERMNCLLKSATSLHAQTSILSITSTISPNDLADFRQHCIDLIMDCCSLPENPEMQAGIRTVHQLMFSYGLFDDLLGVLATILQVTASGFCIKFSMEMPGEAALSLKKKKVNLPKLYSMKLNIFIGKVLSESGMSNSDGNYVVTTAASAAWQVKDLLTSADKRVAVLKSSITEVLFYALRVISQVTIEQCVNWQYLDMSPILAYTALASYKSILNNDLTLKKGGSGDKNVGSHSTSPVLEMMLCDASNHLLCCVEKLFSETDSPSKPRQGKLALPKRSKRKEALGDNSNLNKGVELKAHIPKIKKITNVVKTASTILMCVVDAAIIRQVPFHEVRCMRFASAYAHYVLSALKEHQQGKLPFDEATVKEIFVCLRGSFTYAAKLLHMVLSSSFESSSSPSEISGLANDLLDIIISVELFLRSRYASRIIAVAKPWLPDIILGLSFGHLNNASQPKGSLEDENQNDLNSPVWLVVLSKIELYELSMVSRDGQNNEDRDYENTVFKKLAEMLALRLRKGSPKILDAVGVFFLKSMKAGLGREDFDFVLGLLHFVCVKLVGNEYSTLKGLDGMHDHLKQIFLLITTLIRNLDSNCDRRNRLESAKELLKSIVLNHS